MATHPKTFLTPEQYLEIERKAEFKSEYYQGEMFAMGGARWTHNRLVANLIALLHQQLRSHPCQTVPSDMRVQVEATGMYTYPDAIVVCGEPQFLDETRDTLLNPSLIVEVLSPSTEFYDRVRKFEHYRAVESVSEYLLISSERVSVELYTVSTPSARGGIRPGGKRRPRAASPRRRRRWRADRVGPLAAHCRQQPGRLTRPRIGGSTPRARRLVRESRPHGAPRRLVRG